jgi:hypothetical protein
VPGRRAEHVAAGQCAGHDGRRPAVGHGSRAAEPRAEGAGSGWGRGLHDELAGGRGVLSLLMLQYVKYCTYISSRYVFSEVDGERGWWVVGSGGMMINLQEGRAF